MKIKDCSHSSKHISPKNCVVCELQLTKRVIMEKTKPSSLSWPSYPKSLNSSGPSAPFKGCYRKCRPIKHAWCLPSMAQAWKLALVLLLPLWRFWLTDHWLCVSSPREETPSLLQSWALGILWSKLSSAPLPLHPRKKIFTHVDLFSTQWSAASFKIYESIELELAW